jgi:hypothetical protein
MKKYLKIAALLLTGVLLTIASCKKKDPLDSINFDDPTCAQLVSLIDQDSVTVAKKLAENGYVYTTDKDVMFYNNFYKKSIRRYYNFEYENNKITNVFTFSLYDDKSNMKKDLVKLNNELYNMNLPIFGSHYGASDKRNYCSKSPNVVKEFIENNQYINCDILYCKNDMAYSITCYRWDLGDKPYILWLEVIGSKAEGSHSVEACIEWATEPCK